MRPVFAGVLVLLSAICTADTWKKVKYTDENFAVATPTPMKETKHPIGANGLFVPINTYISVGLDCRCVVTVCLLPPKFKQDTHDVYLSSLVSSYGKFMGGRVLMDSPKLIRNLKGRYIFLEVKERLSAAWIWEKPHRIYVLSFSAPKAVFSRLAPQFFNSFESLTGDR